MLQRHKAFSAFIVRFAAAAVLVAAMTALHRYEILKLDFFENFARTFNDPAELRVRIADWWSYKHLSILSGIGYDAIFVLAGAAVISLLRPLPSLVLLLLLALFYSANIEHVHYNFSHIPLATVVKGLDWTFIRGSGLTPAFIANLIVLAGIALLGWLALSWRVTRGSLAPFAVPVVAVALALPSALDPLETRWMQTHPLVIGPAARANASEAASFDDSAFRPDPPPLASPAGATRHNLLIVYLEGLSQVSLDRGDMAFLQRLGRENLQFTRYFGTQLMTSNGLYSSLTGAMPNFLGPRSPWDTMDDGDPETEVALPRLLRDVGYHTAFLQSADLSFMSKDRHLRQLGFEDVLGREHWSEFRLENGWGIDDESLFRNALGYIDGLSDDRPWMVSLLTVGTHSPYLFPEDFLPEAPPRYRALRQADAAAGILVEGLRARGLLENTVVIFTADESREPGRGSNIANEVVLNWLPLIVVHPDGLNAAVDWPLSATRLRDLALLSVGDISPAKLASLEQPGTPLIFGNAFNSRVFWYDKRDARLFACFTQDFLCAAFDDLADVTDLDGRAPSRVFRSDALRDIFARHEPGRRGGGPVPGPGGAKVTSP